MADRKKKSGVRKYKNWNFLKMKRAFLVKQKKFFISIIFN